jgi:hypothetical protein
MVKREYIDLCLGHEEVITKVIITYTEQPFCFYLSLKTAMYIIPYKCAKC